MRLLACLVLTTVVASAFAQEYVTEAFSKSSVIHLYSSPFKQLSRSAIEDYRAQIEAVNALPNVDVQMVNETIRADDNATEIESGISAIDPSSAIVNAVTDAVKEVVESLSDDALVSEDEAVVVEESVQEDPAPTMEVTEEEEKEDVDETLLEEDEPMLQAPAAETAAPETAIDDVELPMEFNTTVKTVAEPEPEPEPEQDGAQFEAKVPEPVVTAEKEEVEVEEPRQPTKKELKAVDKYNAAVDNVVKILSTRLTMKDALPLNVSNGTLEELDVEVTTVPPTTTTPIPTTTEEPAPPAVPECPTKWAEKCATEKCKSKEKCIQKCKAKGCIKKKNKQKNKIKNRKNEDKNKKNKKKNNNNKNKNKKNKRKNKNKSIGDKLFKPRSDSANMYSNRQSKDLNLDDDMEQARRQGSDPIQMGRKEKKGKNNRRNKINKGRLEPEAKLDYVPLSAEEGPLFATNEELLNSPAIFMGFSNIRRIGDVKVDLSGRNPKFTATIVMGPLDIHLTNPASQLQRTEVTTELTATMHFTAKTVRNRDKLKINEVLVQVPEDESVSVLRSDLELEPEVVSAAQYEVSHGIDIERVARIIHQDLAAAFEEDNILQNLEDHPSLKIQRF